MGNCCSDTKYMYEEMSQQKIRIDLLETQMQMMKTQIEELDKKLAPSYAANVNDPVIKQLQNLSKRVPDFLYQIIQAKQDKTSNNADKEYLKKLRDVCIRWGPYDWSTHPRPVSQPSSDCTTGDDEPQLNTDGIKKRKWQNFTNNKWGSYYAGETDDSGSSPSLPNGPGSFHGGQGVEIVRDGRGIYISRNGWLYEGEWRNEKNGRGRMLLDDGGQYIGEFKDGLKHGQGKEIEANGDYYEGDFEYGKGKHGVGTQYDAFSRRTRQVEYKNGKLIRYLDE